MAFRGFLKRISKVKSTVINDIWIEVLFFTAVAVGAFKLLNKHAAATF